MADLILRIRRMARAIEGGRTRPIGEDAWRIAITDVLEASHFMVGANQIRDEIDKWDCTAAEFMAGDEDAIEVELGLLAHWISLQNRFPRILSRLAAH